MKIIFLDIDGPLIPTRQFICNHYAGVSDTFDAVAVDLIKNLLLDSDAKVVVSSSWPPLLAQNAFAKAGLSEYFHEDWRTPRKFSSNHYHEIGLWLENHPEVTHWIAFDDMPTPKPGGILVDLDDGILIEHFRHAQVLLDVPKNKRLFV